MLFGAEIGKGFSLKYMAKKKFYAVASGRQCGIFEDWATTEEQVKGYSGARYKSFTSREEAEAWLTHPVYETRKVPNSQEASSHNLQKIGKDEIAVFTDGGSINNPGPGGYGVVIEERGERTEFSGGYRHTTNNRMELTAAIVALEQLRGCKKQIFLHSDSSYVVNGVNKGWAKKWQKNGWRKSDKGQVINVDLWQQLLDLLEQLDVQFIWVKGHAGLELNERCDKLAVAAARSTDLAVDRGYEENLHEFF